MPNKGEPYCLYPTVTTRRYPPYLQGLKRRRREGRKEKKSRISYTILLSHPNQAAEKPTRKKEPESLLPQT